METSNLSLFLNYTQVKKYRHLKSDKIRSCLIRIRYSAATVNNTVNNIVGTISPPREILRDHFIFIRAKHFSHSHSRREKNAPRRASRLLINIGGELQKWH